MKKYILSIDQGTTSSRVVLYDHKFIIKSIQQKECIYIDEVVIIFKINKSIKKIGEKTTSKKTDCHIHQILADEKIKIGLIVPLSGEYKSIGKSILKATRLAINKIDDNEGNDKG